MSDKSDQSEYHFVIAYTKDELRVLAKIIARRYARDQIRASLAPLFNTPVWIGLVVFGLFKLGLFARSLVPTVLLTSFVAFFAGVLCYHRMMRKSHQKLKLTEARRGPIKFYVNSIGIRYCGDKFEVRMQWRAIDAVENLKAWVLFRFEHTGLYIPSRVFADDAERFAFLAAAAARIKAAAESPRP